MIPLTDVLSSNTGKNAPEITRGLWAVFIYSYLIVTVEAGEEAVQKGGGGDWYRLISQYLLNTLKIWTRR